MALASGLGTIDAAAQDKRAALIVAQGGLGDQSYNDLAYSGFQRAIEATGIEGRPVESEDVVAQAAEILRRASDAGFGLIVDLEYSHGEPMVEVAKDYPDTNYVILNQVREGANVASVLFQEQEGSYLAGTLAALVTTDTSIKGINAEPIIGVIGGTKSAGIDKFIAGYIEGAKAANPDVEVKVAYSNNFGDPSIGLQMAKAMFEEGADIVYQVAGGTGMGVIQAAKEEGHYAIGVDTDQDGIAPGAVLALDGQADRRGGRERGQGLCRRQVPGRRDDHLRPQGERRRPFGDEAHQGHDPGPDPRGRWNRPSRTSCPAR